MSELKQLLRATLVVTELLLCANAAADESVMTHPHVPSHPNAAEFSFDSAYAQGVRVNIGAANAAGQRLFTVEHCGSLADATLEFTFSQAGYVLVAYEDGDSQQYGETCNVSVRALFTNDKHFSESIVATALEIRLINGRFGVSR